MADRFWSKVAKGDGCWEWIGAKIPKGYGRFYWRGKPRYAHRVSLELAGVIVPDDKMVLHSCDNPSCVNPQHLSVGTGFDNMRDAAAKGRVVRVQDWRGERNPKAKVNASQTDEIARSDEPTRVLANKYGLSATRIRQIRREQSGGGFAMEAF